MAAQDQLTALGNAISSLGRANPSDKSLRQLGEEWTDFYQDVRPLLELFPGPAANVWRGTAFSYWKSRYVTEWNTVEQHGNAPPPSEVRFRVSRQIAEDINLRLQGIKETAKEVGESPGVLLKASLNAAAEAVGKLGPWPWLVGGFFTWLAFFRNRGRQ